MTSVHDHPVNLVNEPRPATGAEARQVAATLAAAFRDDPVIGWAFPDPDRRPVLVPGFFELDVVASLAHRLVDVADPRDGAAVWFPPAAPDEPEDESSPDAYLEAAQECGRAVADLLTLLDERRPATPHYTLELIGTRPRRRGRGLGSALLARGLARCDRAGVPAHLWSSNPRNVPFYQRHGFAVVAEARLPDGPPIWQMWREPH